MASVPRFLEKRLKLRSNREKSAVDRPWRRKFLGYTMSWHRKPQMKVATERVKRLKYKLRGIVRQSRRSNLRRLAHEQMTSLLRDWINYFQLTETRGVLEEPGQWLRLGLKEQQAWRAHQWARPVVECRSREHEPCHAQEAL